MNISKSKTLEFDYNLILDKSPFGVIIFNPDLDVVFANPSCLKMLNVNSLKDITDISIISKCEDKNDLLKKLTSNVSIEYSTTLNSSNECYYNINFTAVLNENSSIGYIICYINDITTQKAEEKLLQGFSFYDSLTGLYNRRSLGKELMKFEASINDLSTGIIFGDVNGLKLTNDVFGHFEGDKLLITMSKILKSSIRECDMAFRFSGDEFVIILPDANDELLKKTCDIITSTCSIYKYEYFKPSISLGYSLKKNDGISFYKSISIAEDNMYKDKLSKSKIHKTEIIKSLKKLVEIMGFEGKDHIRYLKKISLMLGRNVGLSPDSLKQLSLLADLHDIGKISIDKNILEKKSKLTEKEWDIVKKHVENGYQIAQSSKDLLPISEEILSHHERWDGTGYPNGLSGDAIPLLARILSIADAFTVMTSGSSYNEPISPLEALDKIRESAGTQFDPDLVEAFSNILVYEKLRVL